MDCVHACPHDNVRIAAVMPGRDLVADPRELHDIAASEPKLAETLRDRLALHLAESTAAGTLESETGAVPDHLRRQLEALGY